jgi:hypothetical protein
MDITPRESGDRRSPNRTPLSGTDAVRMTIAMGLCRGYFDLAVMALRK